jgi:hypothetical protein
VADYVALAAELTKPAYAGLDDAAAAVAVMSASVTTDRRVPSAEVARLWARRGVLAKAREAGENGGTAGARELGWRVLDIVTFDVLGDLDTTDADDKAEFSTMLNAMVNASLMTADVRTETVALITRAVSPASLIGWPVVTEHDVARARSI